MVQLFLLVAELFLQPAQFLPFVTGFFLEFLVADVEPLLGFEIGFLPCRFGLPLCFLEVFLGGILGASRGLSGHDPSGKQPGNEEDEANSTRKEHAQQKVGHMRLPPGRYEERSIESSGPSAGPLRSLHAFSHPSGRRAGGMAQDIDGLKRLSEGTAGKCLGQDGGIESGKSWIRRSSGTEPSSGLAPVACRTPVQPARVQRYPAAERPGAGRNGDPRWIDAAC